MSYLTGDALAELAAEWWGTPAEFPLFTDFLDAVGSEHVNTECTHDGDTAAGATVRCTFDLHFLRSDDLGLGPYPGNTWDLTVRDGKIVSAAWTLGYLTSGFPVELWLPFSQWMAVEHPDDAVVMTETEPERARPTRDTEESIRLWEQRLEEFVAARATTVGTEELPTRRPVTVTGPVHGGAGQATAAVQDLAAAGYVEEEYLFSGEAERYVADEEQTDDGRWEVTVAGTAPFTSRLIVRRPLDPAAFSGVAVVEWLNVTTGSDAAVSWHYLAEELTARAMPGWASPPR